MNYFRISRLHNEQGFTLIELIIVLVIIAILAAIAIPSYRTFIVRNAEGDAKAKIRNIELQLESWRSSALTFKGFTPKRSDGICTTGNYCYDANNTTIYLPEGSTAGNAKYQIIVVDSISNASLVPEADPDNKSIDITAGRGWKIVGMPMNSFADEAQKLYKDSNKTECALVNTSTTANDLLTDNGCGTNFLRWQ